MTGDNSSSARSKGATADPVESSILVVDDDDANREAIRRRLQRVGFTVRTAADGYEALEQLRQNVFDLVLLDIMMPGLSGLEVLDQIRETRSSTELPVIMQTAMDASEDVVGALTRGASDYVTKPLDFAIVMARVRTQLALRHSVRQARALDKRLAERNFELESANRLLVAAAERTQTELAAAAQVQKALLPVSPPPVAGFEFAWVFRPCRELAGDSLNVFKLGPDHIVLYVLDVSGHGVAAALLAVAATRLLSAASDDDSILLQRSADGSPAVPAGPEEVARRLDQRIPWNPATSQFLTLFYGILNLKTLELRYVSAGHPHAVLLGRRGCSFLPTVDGLPIGVGDAVAEHSWEEQSTLLQKGDRIYVYSDGVSEAMGPAEEYFGKDRLINAVRGGAGLPLNESVAFLEAAIGQWQGGVVAKDDLSILAVECIV